MRGLSYKLDNTGTLTKQYRENDRVSFSRPGIFGHCVAKKPALFMKNLKLDTCVVAYAPISDETCEKMNFPSVLKTFFENGVSTGVDLMVKPSTNAKKFDLNTFREVVYTIDEQNNIKDQNFMEAKFTTNAGDCTCDNMILEAHYNIYFEQSDANSFRLKDFEVDLVYGKLTAKCDAA